MINSQANSKTDITLNGGRQFEIVLLSLSEKILIEVSVKQKAKPAGIRYYNFSKKVLN